VKGGREINPRKFPPFGGKIAKCAKKGKKKPGNAGGGEKKEKPITWTITSRKKTMKLERKQGAQRG